MSSHLLPVPGCLVSDGNRNGVVHSHVENEGVKKAQVAWLGERASRSLHRGHELSSALRPNSAAIHAYVEDESGHSAECTILGRRELGGQEQVLVFFHETGISKWLPYAVFRQLKDVRHRFMSSDYGGWDSAERFRLRTLAFALDIWNENTGSLSRFDVDPLPHQIHLVHHILASGNLNWLIADDVGLGKTIETGLLLAALKQQKRARRILLVTPAGLTRQWQEELKYKFSMDQFQIYGEDFQIADMVHWKIYDHVIASIDRLKAPDHLHKILSAEPWDLIVFDEAHRLTVRQYGLKLEKSERFRLAEALRKRTSNFLFLTATPHQGMTDKFKGLLKLLRPELSAEIDLLELNPEVLGNFVYRNRKSDVTDLEGNFIFNGQTTRAIEVPRPKGARAFEKKLNAYLRRGYAAGKDLGRTGFAIGFVMTIYRKLAASSIAALRQALKNRLHRLRTGEADTLENYADERFSGELEEHQAAGGREEFFDGEIEELSLLIAETDRLLEADEKLTAFLDQVIGNVMRHNSDEKVLIFTEYRTTQAYVQTALEKRFGEGSTSLIHGSMRHDERREAIQHFESEGTFLISTEAGGEGINLQRQCHIMVNYDLPWNPMRLAQRVGRLYRYGQQQHVLVFNMHAPQTADELVLDTLYRRLDQVAGDMATVSDEFNENLKAEIVGELADLIDIEEILEAAQSSSLEHTKDRIEEALQKAKTAAEMQDELFQYAARSDTSETSGQLTLTIEHLRSFTLGMFDLLGAAESVQERFSGRSLRIKLSEQFRDEYPTRGSYIEITFERSLAQDKPDIEMMDLAHPLIRFLLDKARRYDFQGQTARATNLGHEVTLATIQRWQNIRGERVRQELNIFGVTGESINRNPGQFSEWLLHGQATADFTPPGDSAERTEVWMALDNVVQERLAAASSPNLHPESVRDVAVAWGRDT